MKDTDPGVGEGIAAARTQESLIPTDNGLFDLGDCHRPHATVVERLPQGEPEPQPPHEDIQIALFPQEAERRPCQEPRGALVRRGHGEATVDTDLVVNTGRRLPFEEDEFPSPALRRCQDSGSVIGIQKKTP